MSLVQKRIKRRREELGMSQQELANRVGYKSRSSINKIELGINDVGQTALQKIAAALGTTSGALLGEAERPQSEITVLFKRLNDAGRAAALAAVKGILDQPQFRKEDT